MRGFYPDPSKLNTRKGERGWLERQEAAKAKMAGSTLGGEPDSWRAIDAARHADDAERERLAMEDVERRRAANRLLRVTCPCCDAGAVSVERAELILSALDRVPVNENAKIKAIQTKDRRPCPVCDEGHVDGEMAERVVIGLGKLPADRVPSCERLQVLYAVAMAVPYHGIHAVHPTNGAKHPRRAPPIGEFVIPAPETPAPALEPKRKYVLPPHLLKD